MNGLGHSRLENEGLEAAFEKVLDGEGQHVIELVLRLVEKSVTEHSSEKRFTLENSARVLLIQCQQIPGIVTDTAEGVLNPPQLPLAAKPVLPNQLQLGVQTFLFVWTTRLLEGFPIYSIPNNQITYSIVFEMMPHSQITNIRMRLNTKKFRTNECTEYRQVDALSAM